MQPLTEEERLLDSRDLPLHPIVTTGADRSLEVLKGEEQLPEDSSENLVANAQAAIIDFDVRLAVLEEHQKCGQSFQ